MMKKWLAGALIATGAAATIPAVAWSHGGYGGGGMCEHHGMMRGARMDPKEMAEWQDKRLSALKEKLAITKEQEGAWQAYVAEAKKRGELMGRMRELAEAKTTPERHARHIAIEKERLTAMERMTPVLQQLYDTLTPQQRATFDSEHPRHHRGTGPRT
jgi:Spy/CpxP family protein refolding chaperone